MNDELFDLTATPEFDAAVKLHRPGLEARDVTFTFRPLEHDAYALWLERLRGAEGPAAAAPVLFEIIVGWKGIKQPYTSDSLQLLLKRYPRAAADIFTGYRDELHGARQKN